MVFSVNDFWIRSGSPTEYSVIYRKTPDVLLATFGSHEFAQEAIAQALQSGKPVEYLLGVLEVVPLSRRPCVRRKARHHAR